MKRLLLISTLLLAVIPTYSQTNPTLNRWSQNTAYLMRNGKWESGILQPFRYGINQKIEISSYAILMPLMPNAGIKVALGDKYGFRFASEHSFSIPSVFLNFVSRKGTGGLLSPEFDFPFMLGVNNSIIATKPVLGSAFLTFRAGFAFTIRGGKVDPLATIDLPVFYPRMTQYYEGVSIRLATSFKGNICSRWNYEEGLQVFLTTRKENNFHAENTGNILWTVGKSLRIKGGYNLSYGEYPFGTHWQLWPSIDLLFGSRL